MALRDFHYFIRESISTYSESNFQRLNGLRGIRPTDIPFADCVDNVDLFTQNKCGITHGLLDVGWNLAGVGSAVTKSKFLGLNFKSILILFFISKGELQIFYC